MEIFFNAVKAKQFICCQENRYTQLLPSSESF